MYGKRVKQDLRANLSVNPSDQLDSSSTVNKKSNETNTNKIIGCDVPPKRSRLFSAVDPAIITNPHFARARKYGGRRN
jgi:hypothetical protein